MALINCSECGKEISDKAIACPNCGCPVEESTKVKLTAAKCPSCGASIKVNEDETRTQCEYCKSTILVEDAIKRIKIDVSGEVEVKNLPKIDELRKLAQKNFNNEEYDEAYKYYSDIVTLDSNDSFAILKKGICKTMLTSYKEFDYKPAINGFRTSMELEKDEATRKLYITDILKLVIKLENFTHNVYNNLNYKFNDNIYGLIFRLNICTNLYEEILGYCDNDIELKKICYKGIVKNCTEILRDRYYVSTIYKYGKNIEKKYKLQRKYYKDIETKRKKYLDILNKIDPKSAKEYILLHRGYRIDSIFEIREVLILACVIIGAVFGIEYCTIPQLGYILIGLGVILLKPIFSFIFKSHVRLGLVISTILMLICTILIFLNHTSTINRNKFSSNNIIEIKKL